MQDSKFADIYFSEFSSFIFKVSVENVVIDEEEFHGIDVGELAIEILPKRRNQTLCKPINVHYVTCATDRRIFSTSM